MIRHQLQINHKSQDNVKIFSMGLIVYKSFFSIGNNNKTRDWVSRSHKRFQLKPIIFLLIGVMHKLLLFLRLIKITRPRKKRKIRKLKKKSVKKKKRNLLTWMIIMKRTNQIDNNSQHLRIGYRVQWPVANLVVTEQGVLLLGEIVSKSLLKSKDQQVLILQTFFEVLIKQPEKFQNREEQENKMIRMRIMMMKMKKARINEQLLYKFDFILLR